MEMRLWSSDELEAMKRMRAEGKSLEEIAQALGRTRKAVQQKAYCKPLTTAKVIGRKLTEKETEWLVRHYKHTRNEDIQRRFGMGHSMLHRYARALGLKKTPQFMRKTQENAAKAAYASHKRNGTFPPKGYRIPRSAEFCFQKGESNKTRLTPEKFAETVAKSAASRRKTYEAEVRRVHWGFDQRTRLKVVKQTKSKVNYRYRLRKRGYEEDPADHNKYYYTRKTKRSLTMEENASKWGIKFEQRCKPTRQPSRLREWGA